MALQIYMNVSNGTTISPDILPDDGTQDDNFTKVLSTVVVVLFVFITVLGFLGNTLVILVVIIDKNLRKSTYLLVLNLAVADLFFIIICVPFTAFRYATHHWIFGDTWCRLVNYMAFVSAWVSAYTLVIMCLDRLVAIVFAIKLNNIRTRRNATIAIIAIWVVIFLANIPAWMYHGEIHYIYPGNGEARIACSFLLDVEVVSKRTFQLTYFLLGYALPVVVMVISYSIIIAYLMKQKAPVGNASSSLQTKRRVAIMVIIVVSFFIVCWLPIHIILIMANYDIYKPTTNTHVAIQVAANCLAYVNSCMNPVLYTMSSSVFRTAFKRFICRKRCSIRHRDAVTHEITRTHALAETESTTHGNESCSNVNGITTVNNDNDENLEKMPFLNAANKCNNELRRANEENEQCQQTQ